jgi:hypothetical protein
MVAVSTKVVTTQATVSDFVLSFTCYIHVTQILKFTLQIYIALFFNFHVTKR